MPNLYLHDIMTKNVNCLDPEVTLNTVFQTLAKNNYSCCVIADKNRVPLGILTERDLVRIISEQGHSSDLMTQPASKHMFSPPATLAEDTTLEAALDWVESRNIRHLLATSISGEVLGIVTQTNLIKAYSRVVLHHTENLEDTVVQRTEQLESVNKKLVTLSMVDALTGLGNRRAMEVDIMRAHAAAIRQGRPYSIILFDIDYFKKYNDHYGHQSGDTILQLVADHFRQSVRESDAVYRYGGEEFLLIMPETNLEQAMLPVQKIVEGLYNSKTLHVMSPLEYISTSAGIACSVHQGQKVAGWRQVVSLADEALYEAKNAGRNQALTQQTVIIKAGNSK